MKKYFCIAGIHGHYSELIDKLKEVDFDWLDDNHILVIVGGWMAWGEQTDKLFRLFQKFPDKIILIRSTEDVLYGNECFDHSGMDKAKEAFSDIAPKEVDKLLSRTVCKLETEHYVVTSNGVPIENETWDYAISRNGGFFKTPVNSNKIYVTGGIAVEALANMHNQDYTDGFLYSTDRQRVFINGGIAAGGRLLVYIFED